LPNNIFVHSTQIVIYMLEQLRNNYMNSVASHEHNNISVV